MEEEILTDEVIEEIDDTLVDEDFTDEVEEKTFTQDELDRIVKERLSRKEREFERKLSKYENLKSTLQTGIGETVDDVDELNSKIKTLYRENGVEIPEHSERDEIVLAKADAQEIIDLGIEEMESIANKIASKPTNERTIREKTIFNEVVSQLILKKSESELEKQGIDPSVIHKDDFKKFASKFSATTPILEIHELYHKLNNVVEKPKSTGSVKTTPNESAIKDFYTPEEARKFTMRDLDNPKLMKAIEDSMTKW